MHIERNDAIRRIKAALKAITGKAWSVTGGNGTSWGWIDIQGLPRNRNEYGYTNAADRAELVAATGYLVHHQGLAISPDDRRGFVEHIEELSQAQMAAC